MESGNGGASRKGDEPFFPTSTTYTTSTSRFKKKKKSCGGRFFSCFTRHLLMLCVKTENKCVDKGIQWGQAVPGLRNSSESFFFFFFSPPWLKSITQLPVIFQCLVDFALMFAFCPLSLGVLIPVPDSSDIFKNSILAPLQRAYLYDESKQFFRYKSAVLVKNPTLEEKVSLSLDLAFK